MQHDKQLNDGVQPQSGAAREPIDLAQRLALSPREFGAALGRSATFGYRAIYRGWVKPVADCGRLMIPISEVHRFLNRASEYNPKPKQKPQPKSEGEQHEAGQPS